MLAFVTLIHGMTERIRSYSWVPFALLLGQGFGFGE